MRCPFCGSKNVHVVKRGYSWTYGCIGALFFNVFGLLFGFIGQDNLRYHCLDCDEEWE